MRNRRFTKRVKWKGKKGDGGVPAVRCPECGAHTHVASAGEVFKGPIPGNIRELLVCDNYPGCDSFVSINQKRGQFGIPACRRVRSLRVQAHKLQDRIVSKGTMDRTGLYRLTSRYFHIRPSRCHIRYFDEGMCRAVIRFYRLILSGKVMK